MSLERRNVFKVSKSWYLDFKPKAYLNEYYSKIGHENEILLKFIVKSYKKIPPEVRVIDIGSGPTVYQLIAASNAKRKIVIAEYLLQNRKQVELWIRRKKSAYNWSDFTKKILRYENKIKIDRKNILSRENFTRKMVNKVIPIDIRKSKPIGSNVKFDVVSVQFVPESITDSIDNWKIYLKNILSLMKKKGFLVMSALEGANFYKVGKKYFPAAKINRKDILNELIKYDFNPKNIIIKKTKADHPHQGYKGLIFVFAER